MSRPDETHPGYAWWYRAVPILGLLVLAVSWGKHPGVVASCAIAVVLICTVLAAVHHAEIIAVRVGEPYGSLVLALAITAIEVALIISMMSGSEPSPSLARDTVFSALMITCNGILGAALVACTLRGKEVSFTASGAVAGLSSVAVLSGFLLVLPMFTTSSAAGTLSPAQLSFVAAAGIGVYLLYVLVATVRHRDYFLPEEAEEAGGEEHVARPSGRQSWTSAGLLLAALVSVVGLAEVIAPGFEQAVHAAGLPPSAAAVAIAAVVLLPEATAAIRAARRGRFQTSVNLSYGSAMASIGLSLPIVIVWALASGHGIQLGLNPAELVLLIVTMFTGLATVVAGRATLLQGGLHLAVMGGFILLALAP